MNNKSLFNNYCAKTALTKLKSKTEKASKAFKQLNCMPEQNPTLCKESQFNPSTNNMKVIMTDIQLKAGRHMAPK